MVALLNAVSIKIFIRSLFPPVGGCTVIVDCATVFGYPPNGRDDRP